MRWWKEFIIIIINIIIIIIIIIGELKKKGWKSHAHPTEWRGKKINQIVQTMKQAWLY